MPGSDNWLEEAHPGHDGVIVAVKKTDLDELIRLMGEIQRPTIRFDNMAPEIELVRSAINNMRETSCFAASLISSMRGDA